MLLKVRTKGEKLQDGTFRYTYLMYDHISQLSYTNKCCRLNKKEALEFYDWATLKVLNNGSPHDWDYSKYLFPCNQIVFLNARDAEVRLLFNTEAYICNDNGDAIERIYGY